MARNTWDEYYLCNPEPWGKDPDDIVRMAAHNRPQRVLDVGGGDGRHAMYLARTGSQVTVIDKSTVALEYLKRRAEQEHLDITTKCQRLQDSPLSGTYDLVIATSVLHFLKEPATVIARMQRATFPGGTHALEAFCTQNTQDMPHLFTLEEVAALYDGWNIKKLCENTGPLHRHGRGPLHRHAGITLIAQKPKLLSFSDEQYGHEAK
ncbi:methyltransferase domain-containing protein [Candidatus Woesearchaeota archaeon]|nr:methyltransferase domain-containing protein [Candidatus Woesearchaeota archaeon]